MDSYLKYVMKKGNEIRMGNRNKKLNTNGRGNGLPSN